MEHSYIPRYHLYPTNPQILHHLVLELFVRAPGAEKEDAPFYSLVPSGPIYKYGWVLAEQWKQIFSSHPTYKTLVVIAWVDLPPDVSCVVTDDEQLHSFFGTIILDKNAYVGGVVQSAGMFALYAKPIEAQMPFIRAYKHLDNVVPYIINIAKDQIALDDLLDTIVAHHGDDACYVFVQPEEGVEKILAYVESAGR